MKASPMPVKACDAVLTEAVKYTMQHCKIDISLDSLDVSSTSSFWISPRQAMTRFTRNLCENPHCFNGPMHFERQIRSECPEDYVGRIAMPNNKSILANATAWITPIKKEVLDVLPVCTRDLNENVPLFSLSLQLTFKYCMPKLIYSISKAKKSGDKEFYKSTVCSQCAMAVSRNMLASQHLPPFESIVLSNPAIHLHHPHKLNDIVQKTCKNRMISTFVDSVSAATQLSPRRMAVLMGMVSLYFISLYFYIF